MDWQYYHEDTDPNNCAYLVYGLQLLECQVPKQLPFPEEIVYDVGLHLAASNLHWLLLLLVQFDAFLRPSEALGLKADHLVAPVGARYDKWALIVHISELGEKSKSGTSDDSVVLGDHKDHKWMKLVARKLVDQSEDGWLFPGITLASYEAALSRACDELGYSAQILAPHIVRHSGASNDAAHGRRTLASIQKRGRWASKKSVARYEKHGMLQRQWRFVDPARLAYVQKSPDRLASFLARLR